MMSLLFHRAFSGPDTLCKFGYMKWICVFVRCGAKIEMPRFGHCSATKFYMKIDQSMQPVTKGLDREHHSRGEAENKVLSDLHPTTVGHYSIKLTIT